MLVGVYLKNFKCYQGTKYIPVFSDEQNKFTGYLGDNGVGKSAILESLNTYFSNKPIWLRNKDAKKGKSECFVAPVFIIEKKKINKYITKVPKFIGSDLSDLNFDENNKIIVCIARVEDETFKFYDGSKEIDDPSSNDIAKKVFSELNEMYQYVYIKSEVDIDEEAKINSKIYEMVVDSSVVDEVEKKFNENDQKNVLVNNLNAALEKLVSEKLTKNLAEIDPNYEYIGTKGARGKLTTNILARISTEYYLQSKKLRFNKRELENLSSGQRRTALLDFITAILKDKKISSKSKSLILAIDEPEISLDASKKFGQFEKLVQMSENSNSVLFTSHWYGWIAALNKGSSVLIEDTDSGKIIRKYENSNFPFTGIPKYEMRMIFDFLTSLGASAESNPHKKYIICEGPSDVIFLSASLNDDIYKIIPVGKKQVKKISDIFKNYYWKDKGPTAKNVIFLIDTDPEHKDDYDNMYLKRWSQDDDLKISLESGKLNFQNKCTIENILESDIYLNALKSVLPNNKFIQSLSIINKSHTGVDAYNMSKVELRSFGKILAEEGKNGVGKVDIANEYKKLLLASNKETNKIKDLIEKSF